MLKRLLSLIAAALLCVSPAFPQAPVGPPQQISCNKTAYFSSISANTVLVPATAGKLIAVCGWHVTTSSTTSVTFQITAGTQTTTPCDTGTITFTPTLQLLNTAPSSDHIDYATITSQYSQALCINPSSSTIAGLVYYSQY